MLAAFALILFGFWAGAVPFGVLIARWLEVDIRQHGSGNIGATNVTRVLGPLPGAIVLVLDALKGFVPTYLAIRYTGDIWTVMVVGFSAIVGHCFSPFLEFKGGKGVATAMGVFLALSPPLVLLGAGVFAAVLGVTRVPALGSLAGALTIALGFLVEREREAATLAFVVLALLVFTHRVNLAKLFAGTRV